MADVHDLSWIPEEPLHDWVVAQRWFASKSREVTHLHVVEAVPLRTESPMLVLALLEAVFPAGTHETYQVPLGLRPESEGWTERVICAAEGFTVYDGLADPAFGRELLHRMRSDSEVTVDEGVLGFHWAPSASSSHGRHGRRAAGRGGAVELVDRVRRGADPEGVPARGAGREPRAGAAALPVRARVPQHRGAGRLVRLRGPPRGRHARHPPGVPGGGARRLGARARPARRATPTGCSSRCARSAR